MNREMLKIKMNLQFVSLKPEHAAIVPHLRREDVKEIHEMTGLTPDLPVVYSIVHSEKGYAAILDDKPVAVFGIHNGLIWLVATDDIAKYPVTFYRLSKNLFQSLKSGYSFLHNWVHEDNHLSLRWLKWLGFHVEPEVNHFHHVWFKEE